MYRSLGLPILLAALAAAPHRPAGRTATTSEIEAINLTVFPSGRGLPPGAGTAMDGKPLYEARCAACHGARGEGRGTFPALAGGIGSLSSDRPILTVGSYWPYTTTVWDFIRRAMPYYRPGTLTPAQVYALTAYVLRLNGIVADTTVLDQRSLPQIRMPNRDGFVGDARPDFGTRARMR